MERGAQLRDELKGLRLGEKTTEAVRILPRSLAGCWRCNVLLSTEFRSTVVMSMCCDTYDLFSELCQIA